MFGPLPEDDASRAEWEQQAGTVAAWREASGWESEAAAIGRCPGTSTPEKRSEWHQAYRAAGMPEERRPESEMTNGRLLVRVAAAEREEANAPAFVDDQMRDHFHATAEASREAALARAAGDEDKATSWDAQAAAAGESAGRLSDIADVRASWLAATFETREAGRAAREELTARGASTMPVKSKVTAEEWLTSDREARLADDVHRTVTDADVDAYVSTEEEAVKESAPSAQAVEVGTVVTAAIEEARQAEAVLADRASQDAAQPADDDHWRTQQAAAAEAVEVDDHGAD